jgi:hypothetical protein
MPFTSFKVEVTYLSQSQKDIVDCHFLKKTRYDHLGRLETEIVGPNLQEHCNKEVLPFEEAVSINKYFVHDYLYNQSWEKPSLYHLVGHVDFYRVTTFTDRHNKRLLEVAGTHSSPQVHYRYLASDNTVQAVTIYLEQTKLHEYNETVEDRDVS